MRKTFAPVATFLFLFPLAFTAAQPAPPEQPAASLSLESVQVAPAAPGPDTLCSLRVTVRNAGTRPASAFEFAVRVNGQELPAYQRRLFLSPIAPGATGEIRLFNFWSTEASRPAPKDGKLSVDVILAAASWMERKSQDGAEVWTPLGAVEALPATKSVTLTMKK